MTSLGNQPRGLRREKQSKPILLTTELLPILLNVLRYCISPLIRISYNHHTKKDVDGLLPEKEQASSKFESFKLSEEEVKSRRKE